MSQDRREIYTRLYINKKEKKGNIKVDTFISVLTLSSITAEKKSWGHMHRRYFPNQEPVDSNVLVHRASAYLVNKVNNVLQALVIFFICKISQDNN